MPIAGGIALLAVGAILTFALTGSVHGVDLPVVGVILMLAGVLGLLLPRLLVRTRLVRARLVTRNRPAARSRQDVFDDEPQILVDPPDHGPSLNGDRRASDGRRRWAGKGRR